MKYSIVIKLKYINENKISKKYKKKFIFAITLSVTPQFKNS